MKPLKIASLNTHGILFYLPGYFSQVKHVASFFEHNKVDIICFQEVFFKTHFDVLKKMLPTYSYIEYEPTFWGQKGGLVVFSRIPIKNFSFVVYKKRGYLFDISFIDILLAKGFQNITFDNFTIFNTHLTANFDNNWNNTNKYILLQQQQLNQLSASIKQQDNNIFVVGDFNFIDTTQPYKEFIKNLHLIDVFASLKYITTTPKISPRQNKGLRIDYHFIKTKKTVKIIDRKRLFDKQYVIGNKKMYLSDHFGLETVLYLE